MAWTLEITVVNLAEKRFRATGTRTDDVTSEVTSYSVVGMYDASKTKGQNVEAMADAIFDQHKAAMVAKSSKAAFVDTISAAIVTALDGLEG